MAFYDYYAERKISTLGQFLNQRMAKTMCTIINRNIPPGAALLEIGVGNGRLSDLLSPAFDYRGYEPNPVLSNELRKRGRSITCAKTPPLLESDASLGAVVAVHVLEHMNDCNTAVSLLSEIARVLKKDGIAIIICPDHLDLGPLFFDFDYSHNFVTTPNRLCQMVRDTGFAVKEKRFLYGPYTFFPGFFLSKIVKVLYSPLSLFRGDCAFETKGIWRARFLFVRSILLVCSKSGPLG